MEKFNSQEYRDNLAKDLRKIHKADPSKAQAVLNEEKTTKEYEEALSEHLEEKQINKINIDNLLKELSLKVKEVPSGTDKIKDKYKFLKNNEAWYTKYSAMKKLNISLERMNAYIIEYEKKEPDFIVSNTLNGRTYLYKSLIEEIRERISGGESEKIIPEGWHTLQEFSDGALLNMSLDNPAEVIQYLFKEDKEVNEILNSDIDFFDRVRKNSNFIIKKGKDIYWSPSFFKLLNNKISELERIEVSPESKTFGFLVHHCFEFADYHKISKVKAYHVFKSFNTEYENKKTTKIVHYRLVTFYPPDAKLELEKRLLNLEQNLEGGI